MSYKVRFEVEGYQCLRCGHKWVPRSTENEPTICPTCKSPYWNKPRRIEKQEIENAKQTTEQMVKERKKLKKEAKKLAKRD